MNRISENARTYTLCPEYVELLELSEEISNRIFVVLDSRRDDRTIAPIARHFGKGGVLLAEMHLARVVDVTDLVPTR